MYIHKEPFEEVMINVSYKKTEANKRLFSLEITKIKSDKIFDW